MYIPQMAIRIVEIAGKPFDDFPPMLGGASR